MNCLDCNKDLAGKRADARFCDDSCKKRWQRKQKPVGKRGRPRKALGLPEGPASPSSPSVPSQGTDAPPAVEDYMKSDIKRHLETLHSVQDQLLDSGAFKGCLHPEIIIPESIGAPPAKEQQVFPETDASKWLPYVSNHQLAPAFKIGGDVSVKTSLALRQRTKERILAKGLPVAPVKPKKQPVQPEVELVKDAPAAPPVRLPVENHGTTNDLARQMIFGRVKPPVPADLSKPQFHKKKGDS